MHATAKAVPHPLVGGYGSQTIAGGAGDDVIHADQIAGAAAPLLGPLGEVRDGPEGRFGRPEQTAGVTRADGVFFYGAASLPGEDGLGGWKVGADGAPAPVYSQNSLFYDLDDLLTGARAVAAFRWKGADFLISGGLGVSISRLDEGGAPELLDSVAMDWTFALYMPGAFAAWEVDGALQILVGGWMEPGLTVLRWDPLGLRAVARLEDDAALRLDGVADIEIVEKGGRTLALTLSARDGGLSVFELGAGAPRLLDQRAMGDGETGFDLIDGAALAVVERGTETLVFAASRDGALVGYRLDEAGRLTRLSARAGADDLEHARIGGHDYLFAARGEAGVDVLRVGAGGRLDLVETLAPGGEITALGVAVDGDRALLMASRADAGGFDLIAFRPPGDDVVSGGGGDDSILGGGGRDSLSGGSGRDTLLGEGDDDLLRGGSDGDLLAGGDGADALRGEGGADDLSGGAGADDLAGGGGADALDGGRGRDALAGGAGRDRAQGGGGADALDGGAGRDALAGGAGRDVLEGGRGRDALTGGAGRDVFVFGRGDGRDSIADFGRGRDLLRFEDAEDFSDVAVLERGDDVLVRAGGARVLLIDVELGEIGPSDFLFG